MVCGGDEVDALRNLSVLTFRTVEQAFGRIVSSTTLIIRNWDFRQEAGELVAAGQFHDRSIINARTADAIIGILGHSTPLPQTTIREIEEGYERAANGENVGTALFMRSPLTDVHRQWHADLERRLNMQIVYDSYASEVEFQRKLFPHLMMWLLPELGFPNTSGSGP
jgi:hypothetical protein